MAGDAIIGFSEWSEADGVVAPGQTAVASISSISVYSGTVVRFTDPGCSRHDG